MYECGCVKMCVCVPPAYLRSVVYVYLFYLSLRPCRRFSTPRLELPARDIQPTPPQHWVDRDRPCVCIIKYYNMHIRHFEKKNKNNNQSLIFAHRRFLKLHINCGTCGLFLLLINIATSAYARRAGRYVCVRVWLTDTQKRRFMQFPMSSQRVLNLHTLCS